MIGILSGILIGRSTSVPAPSQGQNQNFAPADDGKLSREYKEKVVGSMIRDNAKELQKCYLSHLDKKPKIIEGDLNILFKVEEDGKISSASVTKNEFQDNSVSECVISKIQGQFLSPPPYGINRNISHTLSFKTEATAAKEAKERELNSRPPKVLPVNP